MNRPQEKAVDDILYSSWHNLAARTAGHWPSGSVLLLISVQLHFFLFGIREKRHLRSKPPFIPPSNLIVQPVVLITRFWL